MYLHVLMILFLWGTMTITDFGNKHVELLEVSSCFPSRSHPPILVPALGTPPRGWVGSRPGPLQRDLLSAGGRCPELGRLGRGEWGLLPGKCTHFCEHQALGPQRVAGLLTVPVWEPQALFVPMNSRQGSQHHTGLCQLTRLVVSQQTTCRTRLGPMAQQCADPKSRSAFPQVVILLSLLPYLLLSLDHVDGGQTCWLWRCWFLWRQKGDCPSTGGFPPQRRAEVWCVGRISS